MSKELLEYVGPWLLDHPDDMEIEEVEGERGTTIFEVSVHPDDMGKVIGRRGRIIHSLRSLTRAAGQKQGRVQTVEVVE